VKVDPSVGTAVITFRILGPIRLYQDVRSVDLGRAKIRGLLGILLLSANTPVPIDSIVDRLWDNPNELGSGGVKGREPPPDPPRTLQGYVSRLRRVLEQTQAPAELLREQRRYRLQLDRRLIDYYRFRELAAVGRRAFRAGDHSTAASVLSESVALWQGQPLADLNSSWAQHIADGLARQDLLPAYHSLFSSQLALGQAEHVLEQLRSLIVTYETDPTLIELQMRALADVNGPSSVVSYFHSLREKLPEVFGIDPTERLLHVYRRLIERPVMPESPQRPERVSVSRRLPIFQVPRDLRQFIGRDEILRDLDARLSMAQADSVVTLDGGPGVGKTAIVTHWAHLRRDRFPDGVLYIDLEGYGPGQPSAPATALEAFLTALGFPIEQLPSGLSGRTALLQQELSGQQMLIILDNAYDSAHVRPLLAATSPCPVLITSRQKLSVLAYNDGAYNITVPTLTVDESIALLTGSIGSTRGHLEIAILRDLADLCADLPIALRIVGEQVATWSDVPLPELVEHLRQHLLDAGSDGDRESRTLRAAFDFSVDRLPTNISRFFALLGLYPATEISTEVAAAVTGLSVKDTRLAFAVLVGAHLIHPAPADSYRIHDLLHLYAEDRSRQQQSPDDQEEAVHHMVDWYLYSGLDAVRLILPERPTVPALDETVSTAPRAFADADDARRWFLAERPKIIAVSQRAAERGMHGHLWRLVGTFGSLLYGYYDSGDIVDMVHRQAVASAQIEGAREGESGLLNNLGAIEFQRGHYASAARYFTDALAIFCELGHVYGESIALLNIGNTHLERGQTRRAIEYYERSLAISVRNGNRDVQAAVYHRLGEACHRNDQSSLAADYYTRSLTLRTEDKDSGGQALTLIKLGELNLASGNLEDAVTYSDKARTIGQQIFDGRKTAEALLIKSRSCLALRDFPQAADTAQEAARLYQTLHNIEDEAEARNLSAHAEQAMGQYEQARMDWSSALALYKRLDSTRVTDIRGNLRRLDGLISEMPTQRATLRANRTRLTPAQRPAESSTNEQN
jgi:DNA-binding SARP family transcriptional activator/tetratricopeptide (TPR) repeat protein